MSQKSRIRNVYLLRSCTCKQKIYLLYILGWRKVGMGGIVIIWYSTKIFNINPIKGHAACQTKQKKLKICISLKQFINMWRFFFFLFFFCRKIFKNFAFEWYTIFPVFYVSRGGGLNHGRIFQLYFFLFPSLDENMKISD